MDIFLKSVYNSLGMLFGAITTFSLFFGIFVYFVTLDVKAPVAWIVVAAIIPLSLVVQLLEAIRWIILNSKIELPRTLRHISLNGNGVLLAEPSPLLGQGIAVSIYFVDDGFEILIGEGYVLNVQQDNKVQIAVSSPISGSEDKWGKIQNNKTDALKATIVRPGHQFRNAAQ
ncbi:hypothetical protein [Azospirillum argentinense]